MKLRKLARGMTMYEVFLAIVWVLVIGSILCDVFKGVWR